MHREQFTSLLISPESTVKEAIQRLNETGRKILFIQDSQERLIGALSDGDVRRAIIAGLPLTGSVEHAMTRDFHSLLVTHPDVTGEARRLMQRKMIEQVPILNERGQIVDVLLWVDFLGDEKPRAVNAARTMENPVVIMAGGKGTRLDPFTKILPKPLIPLGEKPIIEHIMDRFSNNGFGRFLLVVNYKKEMIKAYLKEREFPYEIAFVDEDEFYGTAGGLALLRDAIKEPFVVTNCDTILEGSYTDFFDWHCDHGNIMTIIGSHKEFTVPYGVLCMNNGTLERIDEKPKLDIFINTGTYVFDPCVFEFIEDRKHLDMDRLIRLLKEHRADRLSVFPHWGGWFDIGQWDEYDRTRTHFKWEVD